MNEIAINTGDMALVVAFVLLVGGIIKNFTPVKNELIPLITWALGGLLYQWLSGGWADPRQWMMALLSVAGATGLHSATKSTTELMKPTDATRLLLGALAAGLFLTTGMSCRKLDPGADPIVVRTEQFLTTAQSTFLFTLQVNQQDREFWRTKAPAFHEYCETLRRPTPYPLGNGQTNYYPQYRVALLSLNDIKRDYKLGRVSSNALWTALVTLESVRNQGSAWLTIVTNRPVQP